MVQWLRLHAPHAEGLGLTPGRGTTKTQQSQTNKPAGTGQMVRLWQETNRTSCPCGAFFPWGNSNDSKERRYQMGVRSMERADGLGGCEPHGHLRAESVQRPEGQVQVLGSEGSRAKASLLFFFFSFIVGCAGSSLLPSGFLVGANGGYSLLQCMGLSLWWLLLWAMGSGACWLTRGTRA